MILLIFFSETIVILIKGGPVQPKKRTLKWQWITLLFFPFMRLCARSLSLSFFLSRTFSWCDILHLSSFAYCNSCPIETIFPFDAFFFPSHLTQSCCLQGKSRIEKKKNFFSGFLFSLKQEFQKRLFQPFFPEWAETLSKSV